MFTIVSSPSTSYERVREQLLPLGLRQVTQEPGPSQPADFARRKARFRKHRQELDDFQARQNAARAAKEEKVDSELRARLNRVARPATNLSITGAAGDQQPLITPQDMFATDPGVADPAAVPRLHRTPLIHDSFESNDDSIDGASHATISATTLNASKDTSKTTAADSEAVRSKLERYRYQPLHHKTSRPLPSQELDLVDRTTSRHPTTKTHGPCAAPTSLMPVNRRRTLGSGDDAMQDNGSSLAGVVATPSLTTPRRESLCTAQADRSGSRCDSSGLFCTEAGTPCSGLGAGPNSSVPVHNRSDEEHATDNLASVTNTVTTLPACTRKHFRVRCITGRQSIDGDTYYMVSWKSSWVPSDRIITSDDGQYRHIQIDGKDWRIAKTLKRKTKRGVAKELVRWVDDTDEPIRRLRRAISAIIEFETRPLMNRRVVSLDESLIDQSKILPQSDKDFRAAQVHLAKRWPKIEPRNDIDLLPAFRQFVLEDDAKREQSGANQKTHRRLLEMPQLRRLRWNEEFMLKGRFYDFTLPKRNALLLQVVAEDSLNGSCEGCVSDKVPFRECIRDHSEDSPWLNGGCANCGAAWSNSICCHHRVGTAHLEGSSRSRGLKSERLQDFVDPTRSIERILSHIDWDTEDDSDTYSIDSYASSDNSSVHESEINDDDHPTHGDETSDHLADDSNSQRQSTAGAYVEPTLTSVDAQLPDGSAGEQSAYSSTHLAHPNSAPKATRGALVRRQSTIRHATTISTPVATGTNDLGLSKCPNAHAQQNENREPSMLSTFDRSSVTLAVELPASRRVSHNTSDALVAQSPSEHSQMSQRRHAYNSSGPFNSHNSTSPSLPTRTAALDSSNATGTRLAVIPSVESLSRRTKAQMNDVALTEMDDPPASSAQIRRRKRAASGLSSQARPMTRPSTASSLSSQTVSGSEAVIKRDPQSASLTAYTTSDSSAQKKIKRGFAHDDCRLNRPCVHPDNATAHHEPLVTVYRDTTDTSRQFRIGEVQYILSQCTCNWADAFTKAWNGQCEQDGTLHNARLAKPKHLLAVWSDLLLEAAQECCPTHPANRHTITID